MPIRDANGRFVSSKPITASVTQSGLADVVDPERSRRVPINPEFEKPVVSVTVNNPLKKILYWLNEIRRRQTTTFAIKLSIPLIALPVLIFAAFQLGKGEIVLPFIKYKASPTPTVMATPTPTPPTPYSRSGTLKVAKVGTISKYVLALKNGENVLLQAPEALDLSKYGNKLVLVTGFYNRAANLISVTEIAEIEVFNETTLATPSPIYPANGKTPESTPSAL